MQKTIEITFERFEELKMAEIKCQMYKRMYEVLKKQVKTIKK